MGRVALIAGVAVASLAVAPRGIDTPSPGIAREGAVTSAAAGPAYGTYAWPVKGPVIRPFDPPDTRYGSGHRGIDIAAPFGTPVLAPAGGVVAFAGSVAGGLFVSLDHPDGVRTTYSWLSSIGVRAGALLARGEVLGRSGQGHPGVGPPHLHLGARYGGTYIAPMLLLERGSMVGLVRLAPLEAERGRVRPPGH